jgi:hypothetical protein
MDGNEKGTTITGGGDQLARGIAEGWISPATKPRSLGAPKRFLSVEPNVDILDRDRGD